MDEQYKNINNIIDEILGVFYIIVPTFIVGSATFIFKHELKMRLIHLSENFF